MREGFISRGFGGRRRGPETQLPPGQYLEDGFPVLSAGPTPRTPLSGHNCSHWPYRRSMSSPLFVVLSDDVIPLTN